MWRSRCWLPSRQPSVAKMQAHLQQVGAGLCSCCCCCVQHVAALAVVECRPLDSSVWEQRLAARAALEAGSRSAHKPRSWQQLQQLIAR